MFNALERAGRIEAKIVFTFILACKIWVSSLRVFPPNQPANLKESKSIINITAVVVFTIAMWSIGAINNLYQ